VRCSRVKVRKIGATNSWKANAVADLSQNPDADAEIIICFYVLLNSDAWVFCADCLTVITDQQPASYCRFAAVFSPVYLCMRLCINEALFHVLDLENATVAYSMHGTVGSLTSAHIDTYPRPALTCNM